jgi:hypothetical protein
MLLSIGSIYRIIKRNYFSQSEAFTRITFVIGLSNSIIPNKCLSDFTYLYFATFNRTTLTTPWESEEKKYEKRTTIVDICRTQKTSESYENVPRKYLQGIVLVSICEWYIGLLL